MHFYKQVPGYINEKHTEFFKKTLSLVPNNAVWVEIGSWLGKSISFCTVESQLMGKNIKFHCVDTWEGSEEHQDLPVVRQGKLFEEFKKNTLRVGHLITTHRKLSVEAAKTFADESIDAYFIDASHDFDNVYADICAWYPKVKPGGVLGYDDHTTGMVGVREAIAKYHGEVGAPPVENIGRAAYAIKP